MAKTATATTRAPRGTKIVAEAFFTAVNEIPEPQQAGVVKAALALIRDRLKEARDKAKLAKDESMQFCGVRYAANATASLPFAGRKPG